MNTATLSAGAHAPNPPPRPAVVSAAPPPLAGAKLAIGTVALSLATFMNVLDTSIANVSLPAIAGDLGVSPNQGTWVITSFAVANAIAVPLTGWLTQRFGPVRLFLTSIVLFSIASFLCGIAPSMGILIAFRVVQGAVAGPMIPLSQTLLLASYPRERAGMALAMWSMTTLVAPVTGPLLGGWITDNVAWSWIFYINVPVGAVAAWVTWRIYRSREAPTRKLPIDALGLILLVLWVGALQIMLDKGKELDWFHSPEVVTLAVVAVVGFAFFLVWELTDAHPIVDLRLFARRNFWTGALAMSLSYGAFFGSVVLLPLWLQQYMGYTATQAGMALAPVGILALVLAPLVGKQIQRVDPRWFATCSLALFAVVMFMRSRFNTQADLVTILIPTVIQGAAVATFFIPLLTVVLSGLGPERIPAASGLTNFTRITAGAFGTSIATTLWENRASLHHAQLIEHINPYDSATRHALQALQAGPGGLSPEQALARIEGMVNQQAFTLAVNDIFFASSLLFIVLIGLVWLARPGKRQAKIDSGAAH
ncbi:MAG: DHA2 family efflux MFS transporter permease subunit [Gammaproteobacteria bacterium]